MNPGSILAKYKITPCSRNCVDGVNRNDSAGENWHHITCPNHTSACCDGPIYHIYTPGLTKPIQVLLGDLS